MAAHIKHITTHGGNLKFEIRNPRKRGLPSQAFALGGDLFLQTETEVCWSDGCLEGAGAFSTGSLPRINREAIGQ